MLGWQTNDATLPRVDYHSDDVRHYAVNAVVVSDAAADDFEEDSSINIHISLSLND